MDKRLAGAVVAFVLLMAAAYWAAGRTQSSVPTDECVRRCLERGYEPAGMSKYRPKWCLCAANTDVFDPAEPDIDYSEAEP